MMPMIQADVERGTLQAEDARRHPQRHQLRSAVMGGAIQLTDRTLAPRPIEPGDVYVAASDGLMSLSEREIAEIVEQGAGRAAQETANKLVEAVGAKRVAGQDNATVVVVDFRPLGRPAGGQAVALAPTRRPRRPGNRGKGVAIRRISVALALAIVVVGTAVGVTQIGPEFWPSLGEKPRKHVRETAPIDVSPPAAPPPPMSPSTAVQTKPVPSHTPPPDLSPAQSPSALPAPAPAATTPVAPAQPGPAPDPASGPMLVPHSAVPPSPKAAPESANVPPREPTPVTQSPQPFVPRDAKPATIQKQAPATRPLAPGSKQPAAAPASQDRRTDCAPETKADWLKAKASNEPKEIEKFMNKYPGSCEFQAAKQLLRQMQMAPAKTQGTERLPGPGQ